VGVLWYYIVKINIVSKIYSNLLKSLGLGIEMGKMQKRRRRKVKINKAKLSKKLPKSRKPIAPPQKTHKSKKDYDRKIEKKIPKGDV
jgi:hypothetical protein